jgi:hypothetical protein
MEGRLTPVEKMNATQLNEELKSWQINGDTYLKEDGYNKCYSDMERYVKRCIVLGPKTGLLRENFEDMRSRMVRTGDQVLADLDPSDDPYLETVLAALDGKPIQKRQKTREPTLEERIDQGYRGLVEGEQPWELSDGLSDASGLRMDDLRGEGGVADKSPRKSDGRGNGGEAGGYDQGQRGGGVVKKGTKSVDGRSGEHGNSGSAGGSTRMDDLSGGGGVQSQGLHTSDGRKGNSKAVQASESTVPTGSSDPALTKGGYGTVGLSMGSDFQGKGDGSVVPKSLASGDGASGDGASAAKGYEAQGGPSAVSADMSEYQGSEGVEDDSMDSDPHKGQGKVKSDGGLKSASKGGDMSDLQGSAGVVESLTPERIAELISEMEDEDLAVETKKGTCEKCNKPNFICKCEVDVEDDDSGDDGPPISDSQYKGPTRKYHKPGYEKSKLSANESKKRKKALKEERVAAFVGEPDSVAAAVDRALSGDLGLGDEMEDEGLGIEDEMGGDLEADLGAEVVEPVEEGPPLTDEEEEDVGGALDDALGTSEVPEDEVAPEDEVMPEGADEDDLGEDEGSDE